MLRRSILTLVLLNQDMPYFANSVDPDQFDSEEANWSRAVLFDIKFDWLKIRSECGIFSSPELKAQGELLWSLTVHHRRPYVRPSVRPQSLNNISC